MILIQGHSDKFKVTGRKSSIYFIEKHWNVIDLIKIASDPRVCHELDPGSVVQVQGKKKCIIMQYHLWPCSQCQSFWNVKKQFLAFATLMLGLNLEFVFHHSKCKQKHHLRFIYIRNNCTLCISPITRRLTLKFWMRIRKLPYWNIVNIDTRILKLG